MAIPGRVFTLTSDIHLKTIAVIVLVSIIKRGGTSETINKVLPGGNESPRAQFLKHPGNVTVRKGEDVMLSCALLTESSFNSSVVKWSTSLPRNVFFDDSPEISSFHPSGKSITSHLRFDPVTKEMDGLYRCFVFLLFPDSHIEKFPSNFGRVEVHYFLQENELQCHAPVSLVFQDGEIASFKCQGEKCNPAVTFEWRTSFTSQTNISKRFQNDTTVLGEIGIDRSFHGEFVFCIATSRSFPLSSVNCSIGPFFVLREPSVQISPKDPSLIFPIISEVKLRCFAEGYPEDYNYTWTYVPYDFSLNLHVRGNNITITSKNTSFDIHNDTTKNITCFVNNSGGSSHDTVLLGVRTFSENMAACTGPLQTIYNSTLIQNTLYYEHGDKLPILTCSSSLIPQPDIFLNWYVNGRLQQRRHLDFSKIITPRYDGLLIVNDTFEISEDGIVACQTEVPSVMSLYAACSLNSDIVASNVFSVNSTLQYFDDGRVSNPFTITYDQGQSSSTFHSDKSKIKFWNSTKITVTAVIVLVGVLLSIILISWSVRKYSKKNTMLDSFSSFRFRVRFNKSKVMSELDQCQYEDI